MKVLIVSDTHGRDENLEHVVMNEAPFDMFVHCGDVEGREIFIEALVECPCQKRLRPETARRSFSDIRTSRLSRK